MDAKDLDAVAFPFPPLLPCSCFPIEHGLLLEGQKRTRRPEIPPQ